MNATEAPKTTKVRVMRTQTLIVTEYVAVDVCQDADDSKNPESLAENLVKAMDAAGHDIDWQHVSEKVQLYPGPSFDTEILKDEANV